jgi:exodeoxyribonuclease V alpha subunit
MTYFLKPNGGYVKLLPQRLPKHSSVYAMTVHKSQGSEFDKVSLIFPSANESSSFSRELLYTALTRAKVGFTLIATEQQIATAISKRNVRRSGISDLIRS